MTEILRGEWSFAKKPSSNDQNIHSGRIHRKRSQSSDSAMNDRDLKGSVQHVHCLPSKILSLTLTTNGLPNRLVNLCSLLALEFISPAAPWRPVSIWHHYSIHAGQLFRASKTLTSPTRSHLSRSVVFKARSMWVELNLLRNWVLCCNLAGLYWVLFSNEY